MSDKHGGAPADELRYRAIFEHAAISLWEFDVSLLRAMLKDIRKGGEDPRVRLDRDPIFAETAFGLLRVTDVNPGSLRLFGVERKEALLGSPEAVMSDLTRSAMGEIVAALDEGRTQMELEITAAKADGTPLYLLARAFVPREGADYERMLVTLIDITARREAMQKERDATALLQAVIDSSPDSIFVKDTSLRMVLCNKTLASAVGKTPTETYGRTDVENGWDPDLVKGNPRRGIAGWEKDDRAALRGETVQVSNEPSPVGGEIHYFDTQKFPLRAPGGSIIGLVGVGRDVTSRHRAEAELAEERRRFDMLMDNMPDFIYFKDREGRFTRTNASHAAALGLSDPSQAVGRTDFDFHDSESARQAREDEQRILETGEPLVDREERVTLPGSPVEWLLTTKMPLFDQDGSVVGTFGVSRDITRRKRAEMALARERRLLDLMMENLPDYLYFKDRESRFIRTSRSHARALGLRDPSELVGKTDFDFYGDDTARAAYEHERRIMRTGLPMVDFEERESYPGRPDTWVITTKMPYLDEDGQVAGTFGISHDITRRKQLEQRNQQLAALVDSSDDAIVGYGVDRRITVWNRGAEKVYGFTAQEMIGAPTAALIPPDLEDEARRIREKLARGESVEHFETTRLRKDGSRITISLSLSAIRDESNRLTGIASVARDVTAQKAVQAQLSRMQRLESLATLSGGVAHQFNNIHTIVMGYLDLVRHDRDLPPRLAGFMTAAVAAIQRAGAITERILSMAQPPGDPSATVQLDDLARSVLAGFEARIAAEQVRLILDLAKAPPASGEDSRVRLACQSLVSNALDALLGRPVRVVSVRTGRAEGMVYLEVEDTGCGIPSADLPRLFSPFFSRKGEWAPPGSPQAAVRGLGLSLAISAGMVSDYGGRIEVHSTEGAGSVFRIVLPAADAPRRPRV